MAVSRQDSFPKQPKIVVAPSRQWSPHVAIIHTTHQTNSKFMTRLLRSNCSRLGQFRKHRRFHLANSREMSNYSKWHHKSNKSCQMHSRTAIGATSSYRLNERRSTEPRLKWTLALIGPTSISAVDRSASCSSARFRSKTRFLSSSKRSSTC